MALYSLEPARRQMVHVVGFGLGDLFVIVAVELRYPVVKGLLVDDEGSFFQEGVCLWFVRIEHFDVLAFGLSPL